MKREDYPQEVGKAKVYCNFRPSPTEVLLRRSLAKLEAKSSQPGMSEAYLASIRRLPCLVPNCTERRVEAHHMISGAAKGPGERSAFRKSRDWFAIPLCRWPHHQEISDRQTAVREEAFFLGIGMVPHIYDLVGPKGRLWLSRDNADRMLAVLLDAKDRAIRKQRIGRTA